MQIYELVPHPNFAPAEVGKVSVRWNELKDGRLMLRYRIDGCGSLVIPDFRGKGRADDLWKTTCFELFLYDGAGRYREFNFSPSQQWAAYGFSGYRTGRKDVAVTESPEILPEMGSKVFIQTVFLPLRELDGIEGGSLSAVVMERGQRPSYWAMSHHKLEPDFHDPACFGLRLSPRPQR